MKNRMIAVLVCVAMLITAIGCGSSAKSGTGASESAPASQETVAAEPSTEKDSETETASQDAAPEEAVAEEAAVEETAAAEAPAEDAGQAEASDAAVESSDPAAGETEYDLQYAFANVKYDEQGYIFVYPNGTVDPDTILYGDKTLGGLCDYIDEEVLEDGRTINRSFLYDLISVQIIDPLMISSYDQFNQIMMYCLTIANEFYSMDVRVVDLVLSSADQTKQTFEVIAAGKEDSWVLDGHEKKFYFNNGNTEYTSSMFDVQTLAVWSLVLDQYYGENFGESQQQ